MKWISVKDKLPTMTRENAFSNETSGPVLACCSSYKEMKVARYERYDEDCEARWVTDCSEGWNITKEVTHWMPLPDTP